MRRSMWFGSRGTRQRVEAIKRHLYERAWLVDPELDVVRVYRRGAAGLERPVELSREAGDNLTTPLLPGPTLPLSQIFRT